MEETGDREKPLFMGVLGFGFDTLDKNDFLCSNVLRQLKRLPALILPEPRGEPKNGSLSLPSPL